MNKSALMTLLFTAFAIIFQVFETKAAPGDYDPSFGNGGFAVFQVSDLGSVSRIAIQKDGKILIAGRSSFGDTHRLFLRRHNSDGTLDTSFGSNGEAVEQISPSNYRYIQMSLPSEIGLQSDGKILTEFHGKTFRLNAELDSNTMETNSCSNLNGHYSRAAIQAVDKMVSVGVYDDNLILARTLPN